MYLDKVKEFMTTFGQPILDKPTALPDSRQKLRIALLFEELKEYAESSGQLEYFNVLALNSQQEFQEDYWDKDITYVPKIDQIEQLDALLDLQYVLSGAVHEHGFSKIFDIAFEEVHNSNMSKADTNVDDACITLETYRISGVETYFHKKDEKFIHYRKEDNKVLKANKYKLAQLAQFLK